MPLALLFHHLLLNMFRMLVHPSSGACDLFVGLFHVLYCSGSMCVDVTVWSQAPEDGCTKIRDMLSSKWRSNKASDIKLVCLY